MEEKLWVMDRTTLDTSIKTNWKEEDIIGTLVVFFEAENFQKINIT